MVRLSGTGIGEIPIAEARTKLPKLSKETATNTIVSQPILPSVPGVMSA